MAPTDLNATDANPGDANATDANATDANPTDANATDANATDAKPTDANPSDSSQTRPDHTELDHTEPSQTGPKTAFVEVDGVRIAYWDVGKGLPVVFVHGNFASKRWFRTQLDEQLSVQLAEQPEKRGPERSAEARAEAPAETPAEALAELPAEPSAESSSEPPSGEPAGETGGPLPGYRFIALDLPNFGESGPLRAIAAPSAVARGAETTPGSEPTPDGTEVSPGTEATLENYAAALAGLLDELHIERAVLVGHSLGGGVVQTFAVAQPDRVAGLLLVSSPPPSGFASPPGTEEAQRALRSSVEQMSEALAATMPTHRPNDYEQIVADALGLSPEVYGSHNRTLADMDLGDRTHLVTCPVLIVHGEHDYLISEAMARELAEAYPDTRLELWDDVGHSPQVEAPRRFRTLLGEFLEGIAMT